MSDSIRAGSHLNQRTFHEDDYWPSFQSTIISGQVMSAEEMTRLSELSAGEATNGELSTMIDDEEENPCNINIDANATYALAELDEAKNDEDFYDCPSFEKSPANLVRAMASPRFNVIYSPRPYTQPMFYDVQFTSPPEINNSNNSNNSNNVDYLASPRKTRPASARRVSLTKISAAPTSLNTSSPSDHARTGNLLVQMVDDFNDVKSHAQSTPILSSDSGNPSTHSFSESSISSNIDQVRKTLDFQNAETIVLPDPKCQGVQVSMSSQQGEEASQSNKENFYAGRYSKFVIKRKCMFKSPAKVAARPGKVALLTGFFQSRANDSMKLHKSRIPLAIRKATPLPSYVKKSPQVKTRQSGSPSYQIRKSYKLVSSRTSSVSSKAYPSTATSFTSTGNESFLTRNQPKLLRTTRVQSCSDATNTEFTSMDETCKSHSTSDLTSDSTKSTKSFRSSKITKRTYLKLGGSPRQNMSSPKKVSAISKRRSVGLQIKMNISPVKPVSELRKLYTPSKRAGKNAGNLSQQQSVRLTVPKILITHV